MLDKHAHVRTFQVRKHYASWLSEESKKLIIERDEALDTANKSSNPSDRLKYKNLRNSLTNKMRKEKAKWESQKLCNAGKDSSAVWRNVKS